MHIPAHLLVLASLRGAVSFPVLFLYFPTKSTAFYADTYAFIDTFNSNYTEGVAFMSNALRICMHFTSDGKSTFSLIKYMGVNTRIEFKSSVYLLFIDKREKVNNL